MKIMTDVQFYLTIAVPTFAVVLGMIINVFLHRVIAARMKGHGDRIGGFEARMLSFEDTIKKRFEIAIDKVSEMNRRLAALQDRSNGQL